MRARQFYNPFRRPYIWLLVIGLLLATASVAVDTASLSGPGSIPVQKLVDGLYIGMFTSYLTAVLVDGVFREKEERERRRVENTALSELRNPLNNYLGLIRVWYRCSLEDIPESPPQDLRQVLESDELEYVRLLDFSKTYPVIGRGDDYTFLKHSAETIDQFQEDIDDVLQKYSHYMDPELVDALQELQNSTIFGTIQSMAHQNMGLGPDVLPLFAEHGYVDLQDNIDALQRVINYYERPDSPELTFLDISYIWEDDEEPKIGAARMNISLEQLPEVDRTDDPPHRLISEDIFELIEENG